MTFPGLMRSSREPRIPGGWHLSGGISGHRHRGWGRALGIELRRDHLYGREGFPAEYPATAADCPGAKSVLVIITRLEPMWRCERLMLGPSSEDSFYCGCQAPSG